MDLKEVAHERKLKNFFKLGKLLQFSAGAEPRDGQLMVATPRGETVIDYASLGKTAVILAFWVGAQ